MSNIKKISKQEFRKIYPDVEDGEIAIRKIQSPPKDGSISIEEAREAAKNVSIGISSLMHTEGYNNVKIGKEVKDE